MYPNLVRTKPGFYKLQAMGLINKPRQWRSLSEIDSKHRGTITARHAKLKSFSTIYCKTVSEMKKAVRGLDTSGLIYLEDPPDYRVIQGEFTFVSDYYLQYTFENGPLGLRMEGSTSVASGAPALLLLREHVDAQSYDDFHYLLDLCRDDSAVQFPVIEFSVFSTCVGDVPGRNTLIWEVRKY